LIKYATEIQNIIKMKFKEVFVYTLYVYMWRYKSRSFYPLPIDGPMVRLKQVGKS